MNDCNMTTFVAYGGTAVPENKQSSQSGKSSRVTGGRVPLDVIPAAKSRGN